MSEKMTYNVEVKHVFQAPPGRVYDAWLDPELAQKWFGPGLGQTQPVEIDPRVGGTFRIVQTRDGQSVGHSGQYLALERPRHLAFTWATDDDEGHDEVRVDIESIDDGSSVRLVHAIDEQWKEIADQIRQAWASMLKEMDNLLADEKR